MRTRKLAIFLLVAAIVWETFAYWGLNTVAGRRAFDEMAGIIPRLAGIVGALLGFFAAMAGRSGWRLRGRTMARPLCNTPGERGDRHDLDRPGGARA